MDLNDAGTLTRADLAESLHHGRSDCRAPTRGNSSSRFWRTYVHRACRSGENVKISGFGTFVLRDKGERVGRNPKTGVEVPIAPRRVLTFRASQMMRDRIVGAG